MTSSNGRPPAAPDRTAEESPARLPYVSPIVRRFGHVRELTLRIDNMGAMDGMMGTMTRT